MSPVTLEDRVSALEQQVADLKLTRGRDDERTQGTTAALQAERDAYLRSLYAWGQQQLTEAEMSDFTEEEGTDFVRLLNEIEQRRGKE